MKLDKNLQFITDKILETELAIFHCHSNYILKIPSRIVYTSKVDFEGNIWFFIERPPQLISQFEQEFPVGLNYFKKGSTYYLNIFGKARIITDPEELLSLEDFITDEERNKALREQVLIKVKILKADFYDYAYEKKHEFLKKLRAFFYSLFDWTEPDARSFDFSSNSSIHYGF